MIQIIEICIFLVYTYYMDYDVRMKQILHAIYWANQTMVSDGAKSLKF